MIQVKILYGENRCKIKNYNSNEDFYQMSFDLFKKDIRRFAGGIFLVSDQVRIEYRDDEGTFVTMINDSDLQDALRCLAPVPNTDGTFRMVVKINESTTPGAFENIRVKSPEKKKLRPAHGKVSLPTSLPPARKRLSFKVAHDEIREDDEGSDNNGQDTDSDDELDNEPGNSHDKPIDRYIRKTEQKIRENEMAIEKLTREEMGVRHRIETAKSNNRNAGSL